MVSPKTILYIICFFFVFIGVSALITGIYGLLYGLPADIIKEQGLDQSNIQIYLIFSLALAGITLIATIGLLMKREWARYAAMFSGILISATWVTFILMLIVFYFLWMYKPVLDLFKTKPKKINEWGEEVPQ